MHVQKLHAFVNLWTHFLRSSLCCVFMVMLACLCFIVMITDEGAGNDALFFRQTKHCLLLFAIVSNPFRLSANFVICVVIDILAGMSCLRFPWAQIKRLPSLWCLRWLYWRNPRAQHDHWMYSHPQNCHSGGKRGLHSKGVW